MVVSDADFELLFSDDILFLASSCRLPWSKDERDEDTLGRSCAYFVISLPSTTRLSSLATKLPTYTGKGILSRVGE